MAGSSSTMATVLLMGRSLAAARAGGNASPANRHKPSPHCPQRRRRRARGRRVMAAHDRRRAMHVRETRKPRMFGRRPPRPLVWPYPGLTLAAALLFACLPAVARAADGDAEGLMLRDGDAWVPGLAMDTRVDMQVRGLLAEVSVRQTFVNTGTQWREGRYLLPLPENAAV